MPGLFFFVEIAPEEMGTDISQVGSNGTCIRKGGRKTRAIIWVWRPFCFHARGLNIAVAIAIYALAIVVPSLVFTISRLVPNNAVIHFWDISNRHTRLPANLFAKVFWKDRPGDVV